MTTYLVEHSRRIAAPARVAYDIIADYTDGHARIIPPPWFTNLQVDAGGVGAGTKIHFDVRAFGMQQRVSAVVTEPEPGHVLVESYPDTGTITRFIVEPADNGRACTVTFSSSVVSRGGLLGVVERRVMTRFFRRVFDAELGRLDDLARERAAQSSPVGGQVT